MDHEEAQLGSMGTKVAFTGPWYLASHGPDHRHEKPSFVYRYSHIAMQSRDFQMDEVTTDDLTDGRQSMRGQDTRPELFDICAHACSRIHGTRALVHKEIPAIRHHRPCGVKASLNFD